MADTITVTILNHVNIDIAVPAAIVWREIVNGISSGDTFRKQGYAIEPIDSPAAPLGGYHMRMEKDGALVDERITHITERDEAVRRVSIFADFMSYPPGLLVFSSYHARQTATGTNYAIDCHSRMGIDMPEDGDVAAAIATWQTQFQDHLNGSLAALKTRLEAEA